MASSYGGRVPSFLVGCAVAPTAAVAAAASCRALAALAGRRFAAPFLGGLAAYPVLHGLIEPASVYVLGHEVTHSAAAILSGARIKSMKVGPKGGHVVLDKSNAFIALAPYVVPIYTVLWIAAWRLIGTWKPLPGWGLAVGVGATLSFHFVATAGVLWNEHQTDLDHGGGVFSSLAWIVLLNSAVLILVLRGLFPGHVSVRGWAAVVAAGTKGFWRAAAKGASRAARWAAARWSARQAAA